MYYEVECYYSIYFVPLVTQTMRAGAGIQSSPLSYMLLSDGRKVVVERCRSCYPL